MSDPRIARTRGKLHDALRAACAEHPLEQVSVSDIVRRAGLARTTFYLHYSDLNALAVDTCAEVVRETVDALHAWTTVPPADPPPDLERLFSVVRANAPLYRSLLRPGGSGPLGDLLHRELAERSRTERRRRSPGAGDNELVGSAVGAAFTGVLADWLHDEIPGEARELAGRTWRLLFAIHRAFG